MPTAAPAWADLSDDELRARLTARGVPYGVAFDLVDDRDTAGASWRITDTLGDL